MNLLQERILNSLKKEGAKFRRFTSGFLSISLIGLVFSAAPVSALLVTNSDNTVTAPAAVKLDATKAQPVIAGVKNITIVPGQSADDIAIQQAAAVAVAKAQADALAKQKAAVLAVSKVSDPSDFNAVYEQAGTEFGVDPKILKAIHIVETGASGSTAKRNSSGATGPMQFLPSTFRAHAVDGNGDGKAEITNVTDAIYTAAAYLKACGYPDVKKALWGYNPSLSYFNKVTRIANSVTM